MKTLIFGDIHDNYLNYYILENIIKRLDIDKVVCVGDWDSPELVRRYKKFEQELTDKGKSIITVLGNHDNALIDELSLGIGDYKETEKMFLKDHKNNRRDSALSYFENLLEKSSKSGEIYTLETNIINLNENDTIVLHGGLNGDLTSSKNCIGEEKKLWYRLHNIYAKITSLKHYKDNFKEMEKRDLRFMIRGHDHYKMLAVKTKSKIIHFDKHKLKLDHDYKILKDLKYIINPGPLSQGNYAIIESSHDKDTVSFHNIHY